MQTPGQDRNLSEDKYDMQWRLLHLRLLPRRRNSKMLSRRGADAKRYAHELQTPREDRCLSEDKYDV